VGYFVRITDIHQNVLWFLSHQVTFTRARNISAPRIGAWARRQLLMDVSTFASGDVTTDQGISPLSGPQLVRALAQISCA
jgi:hypothetical protein